MAYRVELGPRALEDVKKISALSGSAWFEEFERAIFSLRQMPERCPVAFGLSSKKREIRHLLCGWGHHVYSAYFSIADDLVKVLYVRHVARRPLKRL